jgi:hypothetical protein
MKTAAFLKAAPSIEFRQGTFPVASLDIKKGQVSHTESVVEVLQMKMAQSRAWLRGTPSRFPAINIEPSVIFWRV